MKICPSEKLYVIKVPWDRALGVDEKHFDNVTASVISLEGEVLEETANVYYVFGGKLSSLRGGFLFLQDLRTPLSKGDVSGLAVESARERLARKRMGLNKLFNHSINVLF